jgi:hypothetical protein
MRIPALTAIIGVLVFLALPVLGQDRVLVSAYDAMQANGIVVISNNQNFFGIRFLVYRPGAGVESNVLAPDFGVHASDGSFARLQWKSEFDDKTPVVLRWGRIGKRMIVGQLSAPAGVRVALETYRPWEGSESWGAFSVQIDRRTIYGEQIQATSPGLRRMLLRTDRTGIGAANFNNLASMREMLSKEGHAQQTSAELVVGRFATLSFDLSQNPSIGFLLLLGDDFDAMDREAVKTLQRPVPELLEKAEKDYEATRPFSAGALGDSLEIVTRALNWNRFYWAEKNLELIAPQRLPAGAAAEAEPLVALGMNTFLAATMGALLDGAAASATMHALLEGQLPDGRVPLRRYPLAHPKGEAALTSGRTMLPVGAMCVWRVYMATRDLELLAWAYPRLKQWNEWWTAERPDGIAWRDGNADGLLEHGYDSEAEQGALGARMLSNEAKRKLAFSESGLDDRPQWNGGEPAATDSNGKESAKSDAVKFNDRTRTLEFTTVGLNSLYAADTEMLGMIARELGLSAEASQWQAKYERIRTNINLKLWSEEDKLYLNRHWDGRFSKRLTIENFFPLFAGLADEEHANLLLEALRDPKRFGFQQSMPSISREDPIFDGRSLARGASFAAYDYLLYLGLKRYDFLEEAAELARRSNQAARAMHQKTGRLPDSLPSVETAGAESESARDRNAFAGLYLWFAVEELMTIDPWAGLCFGTTSVSEESRLERILFSDASFDVIAGPKRTIIRRGDKIEVECEGPVRLRGYRSADHAIGFLLETKEQVRLLVPASEGRKITISVDEKVLGSTSAGASASFKVPAGTHKVLIVK